MKSIQGNLHKIIDCKQGVRNHGTYHCPFGATMASNIDIETIFWPQASLFFYCGSGMKDMGETLYVSVWHVVVSAWELWSEGVAWLTSYFHGNNGWYEWYEEGMDAWILRWLGVLSF
jgi:hypothetical protein